MVKQQFVFLLVSLKATHLPTKMIKLAVLAFVGITKKTNFFFKNSDACTEHTPSSRQRDRQRHDCYQVLDGEAVRFTSAAQSGAAPVAIKSIAVGLFFLGDVTTDTRGFGGMTIVQSLSPPSPCGSVLSRRLKFLALAVFAAAVLPAAAQSTVYRCETNGKVNYSDAPCVGAKVIDATPTQGMDKTTGRSRKGSAVQRDELNTAYDNALRPLHGRSHAEMDVLRRRVKLPGSDQAQCAKLDNRLPRLESDATGASPDAKARADVDLYKARKRFFDLKC